MATIRLINLVMFLVFVLCTLRTMMGAEASPVIDSASQPNLHELSGKNEGGQQDGAKQTEPITTQATPSMAPIQSVKANNVRQVRAMTAEKLKRGLTNFMNHLNPAPYFVPPQPQGNKAAAAGSQADPSTIISDAPSADVLIKGPNRLVQARPLGGPLRWGRR